MPTHNPIFCAIDTPDLDQAKRLVQKVQPFIGGIKLGLEFFMAHGAAGYRAIAELGAPIFLDVKLHDIPNTVAGALGALLPLQPDFITIHSSGGAAMMKAAATAADKATGKRPKILGVTILTSLDDEDLTHIGFSYRSDDQVVRLAKLAESSGLDGVICSSAEISVLREHCRPGFILMVPGIRPTLAANDDQKRVMTPQEAIKAGADYLVIGRPITSATDPAAAAQKIAADIKGS